MKHLFLRVHMCVVLRVSILGSLAWRPALYFKCSTRATICRRAGCCGIGLFARRAAGSRAFEGVSAIFEQGMGDASYTKGY